MSLVAILVLPFMALVMGGVIVSIRRGGTTLVRFVEVAAALTIVIAAVSGAIGVGRSIIGNTTTFEVPLTVHVPGVRLPGLILGEPSAIIVSGGADRATLTVTGLGWLSRILLATGSLVQVAATIVIALVVLRLARNVRAGTPFEGLSSSLAQCAVILFLGALVWSVVGGIGSFIAGREALELHSWSMADGTVGADIYPQSTADLSYFGWPEPALFISLPFWPLGVAAVLALLGAVFRTGERLQADTAGLV